MKVATITLLLLGGFVLYVTFQSENEKQAEALNPTCKSNWKLCSDVNDLGDNNVDFTYAKYICKEKADAKASYGTPKWPDDYFSANFTKPDFNRTGLITLMERDAKLQNRFGAFAHVTVTCTYDLSSKTVTALNVYRH